MKWAKEMPMWPKPPSRFLSRVTEIEQEGREMLVAEYQKGVQVAQMQRSIQWLDQSLKAGLPTNVFQSMMAFNR